MVALGRTSLVRLSHETADWAWHIAGSAASSMIIAPEEHHIPQVDRPCNLGLLSFMFIFVASSSLGLPRHF